MSVDTLNEEVTNVSDDTNQLNDVSVEDLTALAEQLTKQQTLIDKLRGNEKHNQQLAKDSGAKNLEDALKNIQQGATTEALDWKGKFETSQSELTTLKDTLLCQEKTDIVTSELDKFNVLDVKTTMKLLDISDLAITDGKVDTTQLETKMTALKTSDPTLFGGDQSDSNNSDTIPDVKNAADSDSNVTNYETEMGNATTQKQIMSIMKKYNKIK